MSKDKIEVSMNVYDIPIVVEALEEANKEIERLNKKIEQYENPEDMTLMFMWCDEKAKDEIKRLNNIINELEKWCLSWKENDKYCYLASNDKDKCRYDIWEEVLDKLQELKGEDKE